jgi:hypothetical protein
VPLHDCIARAVAAEPPLTFVSTEGSIVYVTFDCSQ